MAAALAMTQATLDFPVTTQAESYIVKRLREHGAFIYPVSDAFPIKERIRQAIIDRKLEPVIIGRNSATKKCESYSACFERLYGEPLTKGKNRAQPQSA
jgi:hypothetical protein